METKGANSVTAAACGKARATPRADSRSQTSGNISRRSTPHSTPYALFGQAPCFGWTTLGSAGPR